MNFKVVSTGAKIGNLNEDPKLRIFPSINKFRLNKKACDLIGLDGGDGVTVLADIDSKLFAVHAAIPKTDSKGNILMKDVKMATERKEELIAEGKEIPQEIDYVNSCKLSPRYEFTSGNAIVQTGLEMNVVCDLQESVSGSEIGVDAETVLVFSYVDAKEDTELEEEESEESGESEGTESEEEED